MTLKSDIKKALSKPKTIPELAKKFKTDEYSILVLISELEDSGDVMLSGFGTIYEPDGSPIYLAKYGRRST